MHDQDGNYKHKMLAIVSILPVLRVRVEMFSCGE